MIPGDLRFIDSRASERDEIFCLPRDIDGSWSDDSKAFLLHHGTPIIYVKKHNTDSHMFYEPSGHLFFLFEEFHSTSVRR